MDDPTNFVKSKSLDEHKNQRAEQGYSEWDFWNFHDYHSWMMINVLERFKTGNGYPAELESMDEWVKILDQMIDGFKAHTDISEMTGYDNKPKDMSYIEWQKPLLKRYKRGMKLFTKYYGSLWD